MPKVFVVQEPLRKTPAGVIPRIDYNTLRPYGELVFIFGWGELREQDALRHTKPILDRLRAVLADFCDEDSIVCLGNPALCAMALAVALECNEGYATVLDWDRERRSYREVEIDMGAPAAA